MAKERGRVLAWFLAMVASLAILSEKLIASPKSNESLDSLRAGHETSDASAKGLMWFGIGFVLSAVLIHFGLTKLFFSLRGHYQSAPHREIESQLVSQRQPPPEPRLQSSPSADLKTYLNQEAQILSSYAWIDKKKGIARIPIERAMAVFADQSKVGAK